MKAMEFSWSPNLRHTQKVNQIDEARLVTGLTARALELMAGKGAINAETYCGSKNSYFV